MKKLLFFLIIPILSFGQKVENAQETDKVYVYSQVDEKPNFSYCQGLPGYEEEMCFSGEILNHIRRNLQHPTEAKDVQEKVFITFIIDKNGEFKSAKVDRGDNWYLRKEAVRIISLLPKMEPGKINGNPVSVSFTVSVNFTLE
jgi:hypothetical protein